MAIQQVTIPRTFRNCWRVAGVAHEHVHAQRLCRVLGNERDEEGRGLVRVAFEEHSDDLGSEQALFQPQMLFPA